MFCLRQLGQHFCATFCITLEKIYHLYKDIIVKPENFSGDLITLADTHTNRLDTQSDNEDETLNLTDLLVYHLDISIPINIEVFEPEDRNYHLDQYKSVANKTCLASAISVTNGK